MPGYITLSSVRTGDVMLGKYKTYYVRLG